LALLTSGWGIPQPDISRSVTRWTGNDTCALHMPEAEVRSGAGTDPVLTSIVTEGLTVCGNPLWLRQLVRPTRRNRGTHDPV
jgi:hypothetical protein